MTKLDRLSWQNPAPMTAFPDKLEETSTIWRYVVNSPKVTNPYPTSNPPPPQPNPLILPLSAPSLIRDSVLKACRGKSISRECMSTGNDR